MAFSISTTNPKETNLAHVRVGANTKNAVGNDYFIITSNCKVGWFNRLINRSLNCVDKRLKSTKPHVSISKHIFVDSPETSVIVNKRFPNFIVKDFPTFFDECKDIRVPISLQLRHETKRRKIIGKTQDYWKTPEGDCPVAYVSDIEWLTVRDLFEIENMGDAPVRSHFTASQMKVFIDKVIKAKRLQ